MEIVPKVQEESEDNERNVSENCLGLPTILRRILEEFSNRELIKLSLVNKLWNFEARSVLRDRGCLQARIYSKPIVQRLFDFSAAVRQMRVVPLTGIHVEVDHFGYERDRTCALIPNGLLDIYYQNILDRLTWKHLSVEFCGNWWDCKNCPALGLVKRIVEGYSGVLEELSIVIAMDHPECEFGQVFRGIFQYRIFRSLKTLKLRRAFAIAPIGNAFVKAFVAHAPNLEKLYMDGNIEFEENVMEGSSAVLIASSGFFPLFQHVCESLISVLRTESIHVYCGSLAGFDVELLNRFVPSVMQASQGTLQFVQMDLLFAIPLMCYGICLANVTEVSMIVSDRVVEGIQPEILALVKSFNFTRIFPKLKTVSIWDWHHRVFSSDDISAFLEQGIALSGEALTGRAINIKRLKLLGSLGNLTARFLVEMFPHVTKMSVDVKANWPESPFTVLCEHFGCLAELHVDFNFSSTAANLDSVFCGIFPEEVAELRRNDDEYFKAVNIVPVMPSITSMKDLRVFTVRCGDFITVPTYLFTKVTGLIGFPRCPSLTTVRFQIPLRSPKTLDHMRPYATVVTEIPS